MADYLNKTKDELIEELEFLKQKYELLSESYKKTEDSLKDGLRFRNFADMLPQTVFEMNPSGRITYANNHSFNMFGHTPDELKKGIYVIELIAPEDSARALSSIANMLKGITEYNKEFTAIRKNGTRFPVYIYATQIMENGIAKGLRGMVVDISEQKEADEQLKLMSYVIDKAAQQIVWIDNDGSIIYMNEKACEYSNTEPKSYSKLKIWDIDKKQTPAKWFEFWDKIKREKVAVSHSNRIKKDGKEVYIETHANYQKIGNKELIFAYSVDVTKREKAEADLRKISQAINQSSNSIVITDIEGKIEYINPKFTQVTGYGFDEVIGKSPNIVKSGYIADEIYKDLWNALKAGSKWGGEFLNKKKNGELFWESVLISPVKDEKGNITNYLAVKEDISEKKELELELKRALDRAEESSKLKSSLLANMSHEIRTPLTGILGMSQILSEELNNTFLSQFAKNILISGKRLMTTLNAILDLSELEADTTKVTISEFFLGSHLKYSLGHYIEVAENKNLYFHFNLNDENLAARTDQKLCIQIIMNLIDNAVKYTNQGGISISVDPYEDDERLWLKVTVKDTGIGISEKDQGIIFEEFRQISEGINRAFEGSGLGLALVKKMINLIGAKIELKSSHGTGSEFSVYFPAVEAVSINEDEIFNMYNTQELNVKSENLPSILLVEDNEINTEVVMTFLNKYCNTDHATDGEEAFIMASQKKYELILMDINLGTGIDGVQAAKKIRSLNGYEKTPIVAVTGYAMSSDKKKFLSQGIDYYLAKPFTRDELVDLVSSIISN